MAAVPPLFICISSSPCLCSPASLFFLLFLSMMVLWWPRMVALRWLFFFSPLFLPVSSSSLFCSVSLLCSFSLFAYVFFSFSRSLKEFSPFPSHLSPLVFTRRKKREKGLLPLSSRGTGVGWPGRPLCNSLRAARGACPLCFSPHGRPWVRA